MVNAGRALEDADLDPMGDTSPLPLAFADRNERVGPYAFVWPGDDDIDRSLTINMTPVITEHEFELQPAGSGGPYDGGLVPTPSARRLHLRNSIAVNQPEFHSNMSRTWYELGLCCMSGPVTYSLSTIEVERYEQLQREFAHNYEGNNADHEAALNELYNLAINKSYFARGWRETRDWEKVGFGGQDPRSDFRAGGLFALLNLVYFVKYCPRQF